MRWQRLLGPAAGLGLGALIERRGGRRDRHGRLSADLQSVAGADRGRRVLEGDRLGGRVPAVRFGRQGDHRDGVRRRPDRARGLEPDRRGRQPGRRHAAGLDRRGHRRRRGAGRARGLGHRQGRGPQGQEGRRAVRLDHPLPSAVRARALRRRPGRGRGPQPAAAADRGRLGARRHRRRVRLGPGARPDQAERQGRGHLGRAQRARPADLRWPGRQQDLGRGRTPRGWRSSSG